MTTCTVGPSGAIERSRPWVAAARVGTDGCPIRQRWCERYASGPPSNHVGLRSAGRLITTQSCRLCRSVSGGVALSVGFASRRPRARIPHAPSRGVLICRDFFSVWFQHRQQPCERGASGPWMGVELRRVRSSHASVCRSRATSSSRTALHASSGRRTATDAQAAADASRSRPAGRQRPRLPRRLVA